MAVVHHQPPALPIPLVRQHSEVDVDFRLQRGGQYPPGNLRTTSSSSETPSRLAPSSATTVSTGVSFPTDAPTSAMPET
jgi:hypothetical protein